MTKGPQPTTHNAERVARSTCREKSEIGSSLKRSEKRKHVALRSKMFGDLEKLLSVIWRNRVRRFGENEFGDLEKTCSAIWRKRIQCFGENEFGDLEKMSSAI